MRKTAIAIVSAFLLLASSPDATAGDQKAESQDHFKSGLALMKVEDFSGAAAEFEQSVKLYATKSGLFNLANCYKAMHRYGDSLATYQRLKRDYKSSLSPDMAKQTEKEMEEILSIVGYIELEVTPAEAEVYLDGVQIHRPKNAVGPGNHTIAVSLEGYEAEKRTVNILSKKTVVEKFELKEEEQTTPPVVTPVIAPVGVTPGSGVSGSPCSRDTDCSGEMVCRNSACFGDAAGTAPAAGISAPVTGEGNADDPTQPPPRKGRPDTPGFNIVYGSISFEPVFHAWGILLEGMDDADDDTFETKFWPGFHMAVYGVTSRHTHIGAFYSFLAGEAEKKLWDGGSGFVDKVTFKNHMFGLSFKSGTVFGKRVGLGACMELGMMLAKHEVEISGGSSFENDGFLKGFVMSPRFYIDVMIVKKERFEMAVSTSIGPRLMMIMSSDDSDYDVKYWLTSLGGTIGIALGI